ncbi:hypothetical protein GIB67_001588 [Kingdonia uniflora]|uniref:protein-serine/threonine phosphatase n=1 Tax=Kingdonia uniflora TaxID=39325 RepID=A0A7J7L0R5_9MAGN|nr:hypothetical protein GIB67_001588 [Kingdonia uniflora]
MALFSQQLQISLLLNGILNTSSTGGSLKLKKNNNNIIGGRGERSSAIAIDGGPSSLSGVGSIRWGSIRVQGPREEMEDDVVVRSDEFDGFSFAAVFDGHAGFSSVEFLREELYKECISALNGGLLLRERDINAIKKALQEAFTKVDKKLLSWLEATGKEGGSGSTATVMFVRNDLLIVSHVGDSCVALSRCGKTEILANPHRPFGNNNVSLQEIRRIKEAGGWVCTSLICFYVLLLLVYLSIRLSMEGYVEIFLYPELLVTFDLRQKRLKCWRKGLKREDGPKNLFPGMFAFILIVKFNGDLVTASPDVYHIALGSDDEFILLASDGLWDYMKSSDAVTFVRNQLRQHGNVQQACEALAQAALDRYSQDNISIVIADLGRTDWHNLPPQKQNFLLELSQAFATVCIVSLGIWMSYFLSS